MSDGQVRELAQGEETKGKITAFRQLLDVIGKKQEALPTRKASVEGEVKAYRSMGELIQGRITQRIQKLSALEVPREQIKDEQEWALGLRALCERAAREAANEAMRLEGEARALIVEAQTIGTLSQKAIADERSLDAMQASMDAARPAQDEPEEKPKAKGKKKSPKKPAAKRAPAKKASAKKSNGKADGRST